MSTKISEQTDCYHCGGHIEEDVVFDERHFCCNGCKSVYELLSANNLCEYYQMQDREGAQKVEISTEKFEFLDDEKMADTLASFRDDEITVVSLYLPQMHCASCIWLLENLDKIESGVKNTRVNFVKREITVTFLHRQISLKNLVILLAKLGYEPQINLAGTGNVSKVKKSKKIIYQLGVAGFCFGNMMMITLPEYLGLDVMKEASFARFFGIINFVLSLPVLLFSARDYFSSAWQGIHHRFMNIDIPIAAGLAMIFLRSSYELIFKNSAGFFDSLAGLTFFLLIGKYFQIKTFENLIFDRDFKSFFPLSVIKINADNSQSFVHVSEIAVNDTLMIRNNEIIPADAVLVSDNAQIDNSFVTGESRLIDFKKGDKIYAGGKQIGKSIYIQVVKPLSQSYLTSLWNNEVFKKAEENTYDDITNKASKRFTVYVMTIAFLSAGYWMFFDVEKAFTVFTAVLIITCPCAFALAAPFTLSAGMKELSRIGFYIKNTGVIEKIKNIKTVVFDKTGTLTGHETQVTYTGQTLRDEDVRLVFDAVSQSIHPLSVSIAKYLKLKNARINQIHYFEEIKGEGIVASFSTGDLVKLGSKKLIPEAETFTTSNPMSSLVHLSINNRYSGTFELTNRLRPGTENLISEIGKIKQISLLSGDNDATQSFFKQLFPQKANLLFNQNPEDKLNYIRSLQNKQNKVMMIGDGLNDAGALKQSDVGISLSEKTNSFSPAADVIMEAGQFKLLPAVFQFSDATVQTIRYAFFMSFLYNLAGLFFAVQGLLDPIYCAVLMPVSSVSVVIFTTFMMKLRAKQLFKS